MPAFAKGSFALSFLAVGSLVSSLAQAVPTMVPSPPSINAKGYVLMDFDSGKVIASSNPETAMAPASLTKIMTAYVAGQEMNSGRLAFNDTVTVSRNAWSLNFPDSSKMFIEPGDNIAVEDILRGIMVQSGNDASLALAEHVAGSEPAFVALMNGWASKLGMISTQFINSHGLDGKEIATTPMDMAVLSRAMIADVPDVYDIYSEKSFTWNGITQSNRNRLLWDNSLNVDGMKTGYTSGAGYNLVTSATDDDMRLISVVMGTPSEKARVEESRKLLTYGFRFFETETVLEANAPAVVQRVWLGEQDEISLGVAKDTAITLPRGQMGKVEVEYVIEEPVKAPIAQGQKMGMVRWTLEGDVVMERDLQAISAIERGGFFKRMIDSVKLFFSDLLGGMFS